MSSGLSAEVTDMSIVIDQITWQLAMKDVESPKFGW